MHRAIEGVVRSSRFGSWVRIRVRTRLVQACTSLYKYKLVRVVRTHTYEARTYVRTYVRTAFGGQDFCSHFGLLVTHLDRVSDKAGVLCQKQTRRTMLGVRNSDRRPTTKSTVIFFNN